MALVIKTVAKTALGSIKGNVEMYNGGNVDEILVDLVSQIDAKLTSAMHYKGSVATMDDLPEAPETGDVYNVTETGKNYAWDGSKWDELSGVMDLSAYKTDAENEAKYLQIANFSTKAESEGFRTETEIKGFISAAFTDYGFGTLAKKSEVAKADLAAALASELDAKATQAALEAVDAKFADYTKTADLKALAFKDLVGKGDCTAEFQAIIDAKAEAADLSALETVVGTKAAQADLEALQAVVATKAAAADLTALAARVTDNETAIADHATKIAANTAKFASYTETKDLGVLALLSEADAKSTLDSWGYGKSADVSALKDRIDAIAGVTVPTKETVTIYELWDCVNAIVAAAAEA